MKIFLALLLALVLILPSVFSQSTYPITKIIGKDTVAILSIDQVRQINLDYVKLDEVGELADSLTSIIVSFRMLSTTQQIAIDNLEKQVGTLGLMIDQKDKLIELANKTVQDAWRRSKIKNIANKVTLSTIILGSLTYILFIK